MVHRNSTCMSLTFMKPKIHVLSQQSWQIAFDKPIYLLEFVICGKEGMSLKIYSGWNCFCHRIDKQKLEY